jgi:hypothetical protein
MDRLSFLRSHLGDPASYVLRWDDKPFLTEWALATGGDPLAVHAMSTVDLANHYHASAAPDSPTAIQRATAQAVMQTIAAMPQGRFPDEELVRYLAREECRALIAANPPQRLEVASVRGTAVIEGLTHYRTPLVIKYAAIGDDIMLVGPAGCGKTMIGEHVAQALQLHFYITSTINDTHELIGFVDGMGRYHDTPFRHAFEKGGVWIADEIDAWDANALLAANSALANGYCNFPDTSEPIRRHADFRMIGTANTFGAGGDRLYVGRNELDAASLDRFSIIDVDYDLDIERMLAGGHDRWLEYVWSVRKIVNDKRIRHVVSTRAISKGARALANGIAWSDVVEINLFKGMNSKDRDKIDD